VISEDRLLLSQERLLRLLRSQDADAMLPYSGAVGGSDQRTISDGIVLYLFFTYCISNSRSTIPNIYF